MAFSLPLRERIVRALHGADGAPDETVAAIDYWEPEYQRVIRAPRPQGADAILAKPFRLNEFLATIDEILKVASSPG